MSCSHAALLRRCGLSAVSVAPFAAGNAEADDESRLGGEMGGN